ncbi:MAG TPA: hypothetical protein VK116_20320, partial [Planctomycetota bacterium]|nr:hypothetical protein [Planctomycetota bacterium]
MRHAAVDGRTPMLEAWPLAPEERAKDCRALRRIEIFSGLISHDDARTPDLVELDPVVLGGEEDESFDERAAGLLPRSTATFD